MRSPSSAPIVVQRWPGEDALFTFSLIISLVLWLLATISVVGVLYAGMLGVIFFMLHLGFVAHVRGSGVRLGPEQFPELYARVVQLAQRMGMDAVPDVYIMQAGGALNAFATRFLRSHIVVLFSELLDACGSDESARDMIIAHELGHIHAGHLRWHWILLPSSFIPFLGSALSRAREYTCDRYGLAGAGNVEGATLGLTILAAGATHGPKVNRRALVRQRADINTGLMTLAEWFASHPPLAKRLAAIDPSLTQGVRLPPTGSQRALAIVVAAFVVPAAVGGWLTAMAFSNMAKIAAATAQVGQETAMIDSLGAPPGTRGHVAPPVEAGTATAQRDMFRMAMMIESQRARRQPLPWDIGELAALWASRGPSSAPPLPLDPFDGQAYGYERIGDDYKIWSSGPDQRSGTEDDLVHDSRVERDRSMQR